MVPLYRFSRYAIVLAVLVGLFTYVTLTVSLHATLSSQIIPSTLPVLWKDYEVNRGTPSLCRDVEADKVGRCMLAVTRIYHLKRRPEIVEAVDALRNAQGWQQWFLPPGQQLKLREYALQLDSAVQRISQGYRYEGLDFVAPPHVSASAIFTDVVKLAFSAVVGLILLTTLMQWKAMRLPSHQLSAASTWRGAYQRSLRTSRHLSYLQRLGHALNHRTVLRNHVVAVFFVWVGSLLVYGVNILIRS